QPHMEALVEAVNESSSISVLDDIEIVYVARVPTRRIMRITLWAGTHLPAHPSSMGRVRRPPALPAELAERRPRIALQPLSAHTVKDAAALREVLATVPPQGYAA